MNCKPGDLAIVVKSVSGLNLGHIVRCIRLASESEFRSFRGGPCWVTDQQFPVKNVATGAIRFVPYMPDVCLKPIKPDTDGTADESQAYLPSVPTQPKELT